MVSERSFRFVCLFVEQKAYIFKTRNIGGLIWYFSTHLARSQIIFGWPESRNAGHRIKILGSELHPPHSQRSSDSAWGGTHVLSTSHRLIHRIFMPPGEWVSLSLSSCTRRSRKEDIEEEARWSRVSPVRRKKQGTKSDVQAALWENRKDTSREGPEAEVRVWSAGGGETNLKAISVLGRAVDLNSERPEFKFQFYPWVSYTTLNKALTLSFPMCNSEHEVTTSLNCIFPVLFTFSIIL